MDGIPETDLWDLVVEVLHPSSPPSIGTERPGALRSQWENHATIRTKLKPPTSEESCFREIGVVGPSAKHSHQNALLYIFER